MNDLNVALAIVAGLLLLLGLLSELVKGKLMLSEPLVALSVGVLVGPKLFDWTDVSDWGKTPHVLEQTARLTLAISLVGVALRLPRNYVRNQWKPLAMVLGPAMLLMWLCSSSLFYFFVDLPPLMALLLGAVVTPTDPVIASSIVTGPTAQKNIPARLRHLLSGESGANDGLAFLFVALPLLLLTKSTQQAWREWLLHDVVWEVGAAIAMGAAIGYSVGKALRWSEKHKMTEHISLLTIGLSLSLVTVSAVRLLGTDGILAVFVAGLTFHTVVDGREEDEELWVQEAVTRFFTMPSFVLLGTALPWHDWLQLGWTAFWIVLGILLLRRLPAVLLLSRWLQPVQHRRDTLLLGWFGPIGIAALFYATYAQRKLGDDRVWIWGSLLIAGSVVAHGLSAVPLTRLYGRRNTD